MALVQTEWAWVLLLMKGRIVAQEPTTAGYSPAHPESFGFAADLVRQLLAFASGIIAFTVTLANERAIVSRATLPAGTLEAAWCAYGVSALFGVVALMRMTGLMARAPSEATVYEPMVRWSGFLQILAFFVGTVLVVLAGIEVF